jgi:hypothetical protein
LALTAFLERAWLAFVPTLRDFGQFLRHPAIIEAREEVKVSVKAKIAVQLFVISFLLATGLGLLALPIILMSNAAPGDQITAVLNSSALTMVLAVVVLGPLIEEGMFRGWLSGTSRAIVGTAVLLVVVYGGSILITHLLGEIGAAKQVILFIAGVATLCAFSPLDRGFRIPGFERIFPVLFWGQGVAFGALHLQNVNSDSWAVSVVATLPLMACGLIWGYARMRLGLAWAVLLHATYNVPAAIGSIVLLHWLG